MLLLLLSGFSLPQQSAADVRKIKSVKSLTHMLSRVEKENGKKATFVTMKLQIYMEDVYISLGTIVYVREDAISTAISEMIEQGSTKKEIARLLLRKFQDGEFYE